MRDRELLKRVLKGERLCFEEACVLFEELFEGRLENEQVAGILTAFAVRGETPEEVAAAIKVADSKKVRVEHSLKEVVDTCGTGGDGKGTFNVSTAVAFTLVALGIPVAKHGNKAVTGKVGSADVVESLGIPIVEEPDSARAFLENKRFAFLFAPKFHPAFAKFASVRRSLGIPTIFNLLGPQINPCDPEAQIVGVYSPEKAEVVAQALALLGRKNRVVVCSEDGLDEVSTNAATAVFEIRDGKVKKWSFEPEKVLGSSFPVPVAEDREVALRIFTEAIDGKHEAAAKTVALNAAFALYASGKSDIDEGYEMTLRAIRDGKVGAKIEELKDGVSSKG
ncbi:anthranilate phosphoribosyltransferase [Thermosulfidibacter takaii ABI70S6]|uniref:Anthranilate phosphoribosyltransferase n=1 Tax=Thermosulfidibacter takaii (strain DSM 17441 / JCM 13301 / NBRC 103674 / ABI70S6) TaxID=1298851 RepID=A0A0S3QVB2_THET7|nr:anthranilate phosphoribosyltransferase [Thermosulfidibacter takaii]BAT72278.1 anthranilate phosphoribosyltransferase [Thermosulfidibacter takaii ABI70S6]